MRGSVKPDSPVHELSHTRLPVCGLSHAQLPRVRGWPSQPRLLVTLWTVAPQVALLIGFQAEILEWAASSFSIKLIKR